MLPALKAVHGAYSVPFGVSACNRGETAVTTVHTASRTTIPASFTIALRACLVIVLARSGKSGFAALFGLIRLQVGTCDISLPACRRILSAREYTDRST